MSNESQINSTGSHTSSSINSRAMSRFNEIKSRMKLSLFDQAVASKNYPQKDVDRQRIQELLDHPNQNDKFSAKDPDVNKAIETNRKFVDETFAFINTLPLDDVAKLGFGYILSAFASNNELDFNLGIQKLTEAFDGREEAEEINSEGNKNAGT